MVCTKRISREELNMDAPRVLITHRGWTNLDWRFVMDTLPPHGQENKPCFVYEFIDPRDQSVFYVGITINLYARYKQHMHCDGINPEKDARMQEILIAGHLPIMRTIECAASMGEASKREKLHIWNYRASGVSLLNISIPLFHFRGFGVGPSSPAKLSRRVRATATERDDSWNTRERTFADVIDMLVVVRETGEWPLNISESMCRYYQRSYPEFFSSGSHWAKLRRERIQKAGRLRVHPRPSRSHKARKEEG
jgi:predicted GIY-YIG superfamily endonuclease